MKRFISILLLLAFSRICPAPTVQYDGISTITKPSPIVVPLIGGDAQTQIDGLAGGSGVSSNTLKGWASSTAYEVLTATFDVNNCVQTATVKWPDGSSGTFTTTVEDPTFYAVNAYTVTHVNSGKTVTQTTVTRNAAGLVTTKPALTVI